mmetsp:Transcript_69047/g.174007  ORF Transcript_69047/g.174007 Transcript_69047/m.174007 type:complete len:624 (-) Transcript_69047:87-1958(-)
MVEGTRLTGVANVAATVSAGLLGFAALLAVFSLVLPWWVGSTTVGRLASQSTIESTITLWAFDLSIGVQVPDGAGGTTLEIEKQDMTWSQMCDGATQTASGGAPGACSNMHAIRAFAILSPIFGLAGTAVLLLSRTVSPLLLLFGAFLALLTGLFAFAGVGMGISVSMSGLSGMGVICLLAAVLVSMTSLCGAFYGAGIAMPIDPPPEKKRSTRQQRVQAQREKDIELAGQLEANVASNMQDKSEGELIGSARSGSSDGRRKPPVMLKKVLFWSQEHSGDADAEEIPTEWLEKAFQEIDEDGSGAIELEELVECLNLCGLNASMEVVSTIMSEIDKNMSGDIDIHEFVEFFRQLEELDRFQAKTQQRAQFAQFLCNFCFIAHIIIVSAMLMNFINMEESDDPDGYLIMRNMLMAFSVVLGILLITVICLPAIRLTLGANMAAWERQYNLELKKRIKKPQADDNKDNLRQAAWSTGSAAADGLTDITINAAMFGASYRVSKQNFFQQPAIPDGPRQPSKMSRPGGSRHSSKMHQPQQQQLQMSPAASGVLKGKDGSLERYDPDAYRAAALQAMEMNVPTSFSPMQVRDMDMPKEEPQMPGTLALQDGPTLPGGLTGTGFYQREL